MKRRVLSVQSHVVHGYVGNKSAVFPLQLLGFDVDPINSVHFCNHTGYPSFCGQVVNGDELWKLFQGLEVNFLTGKPDHDGQSLISGPPDRGYSHLITGYIGSDTFLETVARMVHKLREYDPAFCYACDPVMGDDGMFYAPKSLLQIYREKIVPLATLLTPNQFECEHLAGVKIESLEDACAALDVLHGMGSQYVVLTTLEIYGSSHVAMLMSTGVPAKGKKYLLRLPRIATTPSYQFTGSGDLTMALLVARMALSPADLPLALEQVGATLQEVLQETATNGQPGVYRKEDGAKKVVPPELRIIQSKESIEAPAVKFRAELIEWSGRNCDSVLAEKEAKRARTEPSESAG